MIALQMKPSEVKSVIVEALQYLKQTGKLPPAIFIIGDPGIGKSSVVRQATELVAEQTKQIIGFKDTRLLHSDPTDCKGIPFIDSSNMDSLNAVWVKSTDIPTEALVKAGKLPKYGVWLLDEFNLAKPSVQSAMRQAILDHKMGEDDLAAGWIIVAAGNPRSVCYNVFDMPAPDRNRFVWIYFGLDADEWQMYSVTHQLNSDVLAFHRRTGFQYLYKYDEKTVTDAFPSPRTWEFVSRVLEIWHGDKIKKLVFGAVGEAIGNQFYQFLRFKNKVPNIDTIIEGQDIVPTEPDILFLTVGSLVSRYAANKKICARLLQYSEKLPTDFGVYLVRDMFNTDPAYLQKQKSFDVWMNKKKNFSVFLYTS